MSRPVLVVATRNRGKVAELAALLTDLAVELRDLTHFPNVPPVEEANDSYLANAAAKALAVARATELPALADDSGLEVDALGGRPGVRSARFAGEGASDAENIAELLSQIGAGAVASRSARFRCVLVVAMPDGSGLFAEGVCEGQITTEPRGTLGFGYDPVFEHSGTRRTFAELDASIKNRISHRAVACSRLQPLLRDLLGCG